MLFLLLPVAFAQAPIPNPGLYAAVKQTCNKIARDFDGRCKNKDKQDSQTVIYSDCKLEAGKFTLKLVPNPTVDDYGLNAPHCEVTTELSYKLLSLNPNTSTRTIYTPYGSKIVELRNENGQPRHVDITNAKGSVYSYERYVPSKQGHDATFTSLIGVPEKVEPPASAERVKGFITGLVEDLRTPNTADAPAPGVSPPPDTFN